ncbi:MAG TPA: carbohydrate porin [Polyangia bacterium]
MSLSHKQSRYPILLFGVAGVILPAAPAWAEPTPPTSAAAPASAPAPASAAAPTSVPAVAPAAPRPAPPSVDEPRPPAWLRRVFRDEDWNVNFQSTYVWQKHPGFPAPYDGPHSLVHTAESGYTLTATLMLGYRPWRGAEIFVNPEVIQSIELSHLHGLGGFTNAENQRNGSPVPSIYSARAFVRQTIGLGGASSPVEAGPNQFATQVTRRRLVITAGQLAIPDVFDNNAYAHDGRTQFMNWALFTHAASDFAADARGYTWGLALEYYRDDWAFRWGHFAQPKESNGLALDFELWEHFGENVEIQHDHRLWGRAGKLRLMGFCNYARMGRFDDAVAYASLHGGPPDFAPVRRNQAKLGFGLGLEQALGRDLGLFGRFSWNDGRTETYAFTEVDQSVSAGLALRGRRWYRPLDTFGVAGVQNGISDGRRAFLAAGGLGPFLGDGQLPRYAPERILEAYYALAALKGLWATGGYQLIGNPGYNAERGPVSVFSVRLHLEL